MTKLKEKANEYLLNCETEHGFNPHDIRHLLDSIWEELDKYTFELKEQTAPIIYEYQYYVKHFIGSTPSFLTSYMTDEEFNAMSRSRSHSYERVDSSRRLKSKVPFFS